MATFTTKLGLRKPAGTEQVNVATDLNDNFDKLDAAAGATVCTSTTRPGSPYTGQIIFETDTGHQLVYSGSAWRHVPIPVVAATSSILSPYTGMIIFLTTDNMFYRYTGSAWLAIIATGTTNHEARYYQSSTQSFSAATNTPINFQTSVYTTTDVTASGTGNNVFTINRAGLWVLEAGLRLGTGTAAERHLVLSIGDLATRLAGQGENTGAVCTLNVGTEMRLAVNDTIRAYMFSGAAVSSTILDQYTFISLTWLRP